MPAKKRAQTSDLRILVANGVNLDLLGQREPGVYGKGTLADLEAHVRALAPEGVALTFFQTNDEALFLAKISDGWDGAVINPGAWTHTSLALADRLKGLALPFVEVHLSNTMAREEFRHRSYSAPHAAGIVIGLGFDSYVAGLTGLVAKLR